MFGLKRILIAFLTVVFVTAEGFAVDFVIEDHGIATESDGCKIQLQFFTPATVRIIKTPVGGKHAEQSLSVVSTPMNVKFSARRSGKNISVKSDSLTVVLDTDSGKITFLSPKGRRDRKSVV